MSQDSPPPHDLLRAARDEWGPSPATAAAVKRAVALRADPDGGPSDLPVDDAPGPMPAPAPVTRPRVGAIGGATAVVVAGALAVFAFMRSSPPAPAPVATPVVSAAAPSAPLVREPAAVPDSVPLESLPDAVAPTTPRALPRAAAPSASVSGAPRVSGATEAEVDTLGEELALVRAAQAALRDGRPADALRSLAAHRARFATGTLRDERMTLEVLALCSAGRVDEAKAIRRELATISPGSSHLGRLASSCAAP